MSFRLTPQATENFRSLGKPRNFMRVSRNGRVTIPKDIRERFCLGPGKEVEFSVAGGSIVLKEARKKLNLAKWKGSYADAFTTLGYSSIDKFIDDVRGR